jgi:hypothetical protein
LSTPASNWQQQVVTGWLILPNYLFGFIGGFDAHQHVGAAFHNNQLSRSGTPDSSNFFELHQHIPGFDKSSLSRGFF